MANPNDAVFEIDAGKILAKLHLAGLLAIPNSIVINTGILNPVAKGDPKNPGNVEFDLDNKSGEYLFAVMRLLQYLVQIDIKKNKKLIDIDKKLLKLKLPSIFSTDDTTKENTEKSNNEEDNNKKKEELDKKTSLTDPDALKKTETKNESTYIKSFLEFITEEAEDKEKKEEEKKKKELQKIYNELFKELDSIAKFDGRDKKKNMFDDGGYPTGKHEEGKELEEIKLFNSCLKKENEARNLYKKEQLEKLLKDSFEDIKTYFKTVSGQLNASKIKLSDIIALNADVDGKTKDPTQFKEIKDYKITTESVDKNIEKEEEKILLTKPNEWILRNIMLAIGFSVEIEAM